MESILKDGVYYENSEETQPHCLQPSCKFQHVVPTTRMQYVCGLWMVGVQLRQGTSWQRQANQE